jgi:FtsX-like permease family
LGAVGLAFRAELRRRWRSWLAIAILISVVGGLVLAAAAAGRRTESAFPRFVSAHGFDAFVYADQPEPKVATLPGVTSATTVVIPDIGNATCRCTHPIDQSGFSVLAIGQGISPYRLLSGHLPDPASTNQVLASFTLQQDYGVQIGTVIRVPFEAPSEAAAYENPNVPLPDPRGPSVAFHVVGIEATEYDFPSGDAPSYQLFTTPAFARTVLPRSADEYQYFVRLRRGAAGLPRFDGAVLALRRGLGFVAGSSEDGQAIAVQESIHPQAVGWWFLALLAALVGLAVVGQALGRQSIIESEDYPTMAALGVSRRQLVALGSARNLLVGLVGALGAMGIAAALSPIAPLGEARIAETATGVTFDALVLPLGALATVAIVLALGVWPAVRAAGTLRSDDASIASHPSSVAAYLAGTGAPPSAVIGVRNALERRSGGATVPLGSTLLGTVLAVVALSGTGVFGASLSHLTATPRLYGDPAQLSFNLDGGGQDPVLLRSLEHNRAVTGVNDGVGAGELAINKVTVGALVANAVRGPLLVSTVDGHLPRGAGQIALGATTMRQVGAHLGSVVHVEIANRPGKAPANVPFRVVAQVSLPVLGGYVSLGTGALITTVAFEDATCPSGPGRAACRAQVVAHSGAGILASFVPGPRGQAAIRYYFDRNQGLAAFPVIPTSLVNFGEAVNFPLIFGVMLAVFGAATLAHLLVVSVSRRRREIGLLKVLGFVNGQVASTVAWQATTMAVVGIVIGIPLGVAAGAAVWHTFANNLGAVPVSVVPVSLLVVLAAGVLVVANLIAVVPALVATRSRPGVLLRTP